MEEPESRARSAVPAERWAANHHPLLEMQGPERENAPRDAELRLITALIERHHKILYLRRNNGEAKLALHF